MAAEDWPRGGAIGRVEDWKARLDQVVAECDRLREALEGVNLQLDAALRMHVYSFPIPDDDGNMRRARAVEDCIAGAKQIIAALQEKQP